MALRSDHYYDDHHHDQDDEDDDGLAQRLVVTYGVRGGIQRDTSCTASLHEPVSSLTEFSVNCEELKSKIQQGSTY